MKKFLIFSFLVVVLFSFVPFADAQTGGTCEYGRTNCGGDFKLQNNCWQGWYAHWYPNGIWYSCPDELDTPAFDCNCVQNLSVDIKASYNNGPYSDGPLIIPSGSGATLKWESTGAQSCTASGDWGGSKPTSGTYPTGNITSKKTYTITCRNVKTETRIDTVVVDVTGGIGPGPGGGGPQPGLTLTARPTTVDSGQSSVLTWSTQNVSTCTASANPANSNWTGSKPIGTGKTQSTGALTVTTNFRLNCNGEYGPIGRNVTVTVSQPSAMPKGAHEAASCEVTTGWSCDPDAWNNTVTVDFFINEGGWQKIGSTQANLPRSDIASQCNGKPNHGFSFAIPASLQDGQAHEVSAWPRDIPTGNRAPTPLSVPQTVNCGGEPNPDPTVTLTADPATVGYGGSTVLNWSSTNADNGCVASATPANSQWSGTKSTAGNQTITGMEDSTIFTITCSNVDGVSVSDSASVDVGPPEAVITLTANPGAIIEGDTTTLTWEALYVVPGSCEASEGWSGPRGESGEEESDPLLDDTTFTLTCEGLNGEIVEESVTVTVSAGEAGTLSADLKVNTGGVYGDSGSGAVPLEGVDLKGIVSGTATGPITYDFYCDVSEPEPSISETVYTEESPHVREYMDLCDYYVEGKYFAKLTATRGGVQASDTAKILVGQSCAFAYRPSSRTFTFESVTPLRGLIRDIVSRIRYAGGGDT